MRVLPGFGGGSPPAVQEQEALPARDDEAIAAAKEERRLQNIQKNRKRAKTRLRDSQIGTANTRGGSQLGSGSDDNDTYTGS